LNKALLIGLFGCMSALLPKAGNITSTTKFTHPEKASLSGRKLPPARCKEFNSSILNIHVKYSNLSYFIRLETSFLGYPSPWQDIPFLENTSPLLPKMK